MEPTIVFNHNHQLGEGCVWDDRAQVLWWIDILPGHLHRLDPATGAHARFEVGQMVGTLGLCEDARLLLAMENGLAFFDPATGVLDLIGDPEADRPGNRFNDGKPDPSGSFYAGTMGKVIRDKLGAFYRLGQDLQVEKLFDGVTVSNGLCWDSAETTMYYIDTPTQRVDAFDFNPQTGVATNRRPAFSIPASAGFPDGMTIDSEDMLWIAHYGGGAVRRWNPQTGEQLMAIDLPVSKVTCCTFGGSNLDTLYITTAAQRTSLDDEPLAGSVFSVRTGHTGRPAYRFRGKSN